MKLNSSIPATLLVAMELPTFVPRRGNPGKIYPLATINYALRLCALRRICFDTTGRVPRKHTYRAIATEVGVWSKNTISRWDHSDMSADAIYARLRR